MQKEANQEKKTIREEQRESRHVQEKDLTHPSKYAKEKTAHTQANTSKKEDTTVQPAKATGSSRREGGKKENNNNNNNNNNSNSNINKQKKIKRKTK